MEENRAIEKNCKKHENNDYVLTVFGIQGINGLKERCEIIKKETQNIKKENNRQLEFLYCISGYKNECDYTNLIYRTLFGKTAKELEKEYGLKPKESLRDYFIESDLIKVQDMETLVSSLIKCGWGYAEIKEFITTKAQAMIE